MNHRLLILALLFAGCAAPNPQGYQTAELDLFYSTEVTAAAVHKPQEDTSTFDVVDDAEPIELTGDFSLELAMDLARTNAISVLQAADAHLAASADLQIVTTDSYYPHLSVGAQMGRVRGRVQGTDGTFLDDIDKQNTNLGMSLRLDIDLATATHGIAAARQSIRASTWDWIAAELAAETAAALFYHDLLEAGARVEIAEAAVDRASAYHALSEARFQAGAGLEADVLRALAHLAEARQNRVQALAARGHASTQLAELLGLDPLRPLEPTDSLVPRELVEDIVEVDVAAHPLLEASRARLAAAAAKLKEERASWFLPELIVDAGFNDFGSEYGELEDQETLTAAISWDLSPSVLARADRAHADHSRARHDAEAEKRRVESALVRAQISALASEELLEATQARVEASRAAVALERTRHEEGDALLIELLDAEVSLLRAETASAAAICSHNRAQHLLRQALGG